MSGPGPRQGRALELEAVEKSLGYRRVLSGVTFDAGEGELIALLGRNGAGKSTLLRIVATILRPSGGVGRVWGRSLDGERDAARALMGYLGHGSGLYDGMTVKENLWLAGRLRGLSDLARRVDAVMESSGLALYRDTMVRHLSKGWTRRTALERVLLHTPPLLLLDEPFDGLDPDGQASLASRLTQHRTQGGTVLLVTHDLEQTRALATRALVLSGGKLAHDVAPGDLTAEMLRG